MSHLRSLASGLKISVFETVRRDNVGEYKTKNNVFGFVIDAYEENSQLPEFIKNLKGHLQQKLMKGKREDCDTVFRDDPSDRDDLVKLMEKIEENKGKALPNDMKELNARQSSHLLRIFYRELCTPLVPRRSIPEDVRTELKKGKELSPPVRESFKNHLAKQPKSHRFFLKDFCTFMNLCQMFERKTEIGLGHLASIFCLDIVKELDDVERAEKGDKSLIVDAIVSRNALHVILGFYLHWF